MTLFMVNKTSYARALATIRATDNQSIMQSLLKKLMFRQHKKCIDRIDAALIIQCIDYPVH
jgi:hypothetical protein